MKFSGFSKDFKTAFKIHFETDLVTVNLII